MLTSLLCAATLTRSTTDLTFVRHGETLANATGKYNSRTIDTFSPKGEKQVAALTLKLLKEKPYDIILVSPSPRALNTVAPYLKANGKKAQVWTLLYECCTQKRPAGAHATKFTFSKQSVKISASIGSQFRVDRSDSFLPSSPDYNSGLAQVEASVRAFQSKFAGSRVLIVGHSGHGGQFLKALTGKSFTVKNATPIHVRF